MKQINTKYVASVGEEDKERLSIQHETFAPGTQRFLKKIGLKSGMKVLVVGCGAGDETVMIAHLVAPTGSVLAIDISLEQVTVAENRVCEERLQNVVFKILSVDELEHLSESFDLVYCRMVLGHISHPELALRKMYDRVKIGGILACEELNISSCYAQPTSDAFNQHITLLCKFVKMYGGDPELGTKLASMFKELNNGEVFKEIFQPMVTETRLKRAALLSAKSCGPQYIASGLANEDEVKQLLENIQEEVVDDGNVKLVQCEMVQAATIRYR